MTPTDSLHVGQWIAVTADRDEQRIEASPDVVRVGTTSFSGEPMQILAISLPFLAVWLPKVERADSIDVRRFEVVRLGKPYVRQMLKFPTIHETDIASATEIEYREAETGGDCPVCGSPLSQQSAVTEDYSLHFSCEKCGFEGFAP